MRKNRGSARTRKSRQRSKVQENNVQIDPNAIIKDIIAAAEKKGGINYIFTLMRLTGMSYNTPDPLLTLQAILSEINSRTIREEPLQQYYRIISLLNEPLALLINLLNRTRDLPYDHHPFLHLYKGQFPNWITPTGIELIDEVIKTAREARRPEIIQLINEAWPKQILKSQNNEQTMFDLTQVRKALLASRSLLNALLTIYFGERLRYKQFNKLYKCPNFEIIELLTDDEFGLCGFAIHFSNGCNARFIRTPNTTECINIMLDYPIQFHCGEIIKLCDEWRIGDKRLYEVGLPGRYNDFGQWKPIIYPGNVEHLQEEVFAFSDDPEVAGCFFYMLCTGHRIIEFVIRTSIELPTESITLGDRFHLWKCPRIEDGSNIYSNYYIYDGWLEVDNTDPDSIKSDIVYIGIGINRLAFTFNASVNWCLKYKMLDHAEFCAKPTEEDLRVLDSLLKKFPTTNDAFILDAAIDWYNKGRSSRNIFTAFICYYVALENVAIAVAEGKADFGLSYSPSAGSPANDLNESIQALYNEYYHINRAEFVRRAYFDCIVGISRKVKSVTELVFGKKHPYINSLFQGKNSLTSIRGKLAHGDITLLNKDDERLVREHIGDMARITREFLCRIIFLLEHSESLSSWSSKLTGHMKMTDPRNYMAISNEDFLPTKDWRIRPEWCE